MRLARLARPESLLLPLALQPDQLRFSLPSRALPTLEDGNSIQVGLAETMRLLITERIDPRTAALLLREPRVAASNLKHVSFEPNLPTQVVIDRDCVERRPIGATAWSNAAGCEYDSLSQITEAEEKDSALKRLIDLLINKPDTVPIKIKRYKNGQPYLEN